MCRVIKASPSATPIEGAPRQRPSPMCSLRAGQERRRAMQSDGHWPTGSRGGASRRRVFEKLPKKSKSTLPEAGAAFAAENRGHPLPFALPDRASAGDARRMPAAGSSWLGYARTPPRRPYPERRAADRWRLVKPPQRMVEIRSFSCFRRDEARRCHRICHRKAAQFSECSIPAAVPWERLGLSFPASMPAPNRLPSTSSRSPDGGSRSSSGAPTLW